MSRRKGPLKSTGRRTTKGRTGGKGAPVGTDDSDLVLRLAVVEAHLSQVVAEADHEQCKQSLSCLRELLADVREGRRGDNLFPNRAARFIVPSLLLAQSFRFVCPCVKSGEGFKEVFHYTTGITVDRWTYAVTHIVPVAFSRQSAGGVRAADDSSIRALEWLDRIGLPLLLHVHSHPGYGPRSNHPSATDLTLARRLAKGSHVAIGAIFSRDIQHQNVGYVRFFADESKPFSVDVRGNFAKELNADEKLYEITMADSDASFRADSAGK